MVSAIGKKIVKMATEDECYDVIVLGAGVEGSSTAYYLTNKAGIKNVLLLEQFTALHNQGSSHGCTRCIHRGYKISQYLKIINESYRMWNSLEEEGRVQLYVRTGLLYFLPKDSSLLNERCTSLETNGVSNETLSASEGNTRYSSQLSIPSDYSCLLEDDAGIIIADKVMSLYQKLFVSAGGKLLDEHPVTEIIPGAVITVNTAKATFRTKKLIITAGAWTGTLLKSLGIELPLKVVHTELVYWKVDSPECFSSANFPAFVFKDGSNNFFYGQPAHEYPELVKICCHFGEEIKAGDHKDIKSNITVDILSKIISQYLKGVSTTPSRVESCMYTSTVSGDPILDRHPKHYNIIIGAGFSGRGFKWSPVIGKILSELALDITPSFDLSLFKLNI